MSQASFSITMPHIVVVGTSLSLLCINYITALKQNIPQALTGSSAGEIFSGNFVIWPAHTNTNIRKIVSKFCHVPPSCKLYILKWISINPQQELMFYVPVIQNETYRQNIILLKQNCIILMYKYNNMQINRNLNTFKEFLAFLIIKHIIISVWIYHISNYYLIYLNNMLWKLGQWLNLALRTY